MKCVIINRNYPPQKGITGHSANELAKYLLSKGLDIAVVHVDGEYAGGGQLESKVFGEVFSVKTFYNGKNKFLRLIMCLIEGRALLKKVISLKPEVIIAMTDPPLLNYWASKYSKKYNIPWIYWTMDLFPEAFVSAGLIGKKNFVYKFFKKKSININPKFLITLGARQAKHINKELIKPQKVIILPCGISDSAKKNHNIDSEMDFGDKISLCYAGNLGEAHDECFLRHVIDSIDPKKHVLLLALYGVKAKKIIDYAINKEGVLVVDSIKRENMNSIDIHLISLKSQWDHICVPSKAISAVSEGSTILFNCSEENDNWVLLKESGWRIDSEPKKISEFLDSVTVDEINYKREKSKMMSIKLQELKIKSYEDIYNGIVQ